GVAPGWREVGSRRGASSKERLLELRRRVGWARPFGLPLSLISGREACELFPLMSAAGIEGAAYLPTDGRIDPASLAGALAAGAPQRRGPRPTPRPRRAGHGGRAGGPAPATPARGAP